MRVAIEPRVIYVSLVEEAEYSSPVRERLLDKVLAYRDDMKREFRLLDHGPGIAGDESIPPYAVTTPTDVVVLLSDKYPRQRISKHPIAEGELTPELNHFLHQARKRAYNVWLAVVQDIEWGRVVVEGTTLLDFKAYLHELSPNHGKFEAADRNVLDGAVGRAARLLAAHDVAGCRYCGGAQPELKPRSLIGRIGQIFSRKGS